MRQASLFLASALLAATAAQADEGMWTFHNVPTATIKQKLGVEITPQWLDRVRNATIRLSNCTASFVSPNGLILTNFHCSWECLEQNSTKEKSLLLDGYLAENREKEVKCQTQVADVLVGFEDVTAKIAAATKGQDDKTANDTRKATRTQLEQACEQASRKDKKSGPLKCESVELYQGGQYFIYKYKRYDDVRLVFAPEDAIGQFGGDPDNFQFPRWTLDMSVLRAYENGKPAVTPNHLKIDFAGPAEGAPVFVSGHPGSTDRLLTRSQLLTMRNTDLPQWLLRNSELRGRYIQFGKASEENDRIIGAPLSSLQNGIKVRRKELDALHSDALLAQKAKEEADLLAKVKADPELSRTIGNPWADVEKAQLVEEGISLPYTYLEAAGGFNSRLFRYARTLVRGAAERGKKEEDRLREYRETALPRIEQQLKAKVPVYNELEQLTLSFSLERMREWLGPDHEIVRMLLVKDSPDSLAKRLLEGTKLADPEVRMQLWSGGQAAIDASSDPMIQLAKSIDAQSRAVRKRYEDEVEAPVQSASEKIAKARFAALGTSVYPDATFTLRLNYGTVQGWNEAGRPVEPFTYLGRLYERATDAPPFKLPEKWSAAKDKLDPKTKFDLATNNDITGGNSGSPLIDAKGNIVGLIFDGNIHSISGSFWFDTEKNRSIAVHPAIMKVALDQVYGAKALLKELQ